MSGVKLKVITTLLFVLILAASTCYSQSGASSPYSRYGIGNIQDKSFNLSSSIGGLSLAINEPNYINFSNPASYGYFKPRTFIFETGVVTNSMKLITSAEEQTTFNTAISFLAFAFPVTKWWGSSFGIRPFSKVNYRVSDEGSINNETIDYLYEGEGGINQIYWGNAINIKNLSLGVNASYLFGPLEKTRREIFTQSNVFHFYHSESTNVGGLYFNYGIQYSYTFDSLFSKDERDKLTITAGAVFDLATNIRAKRETIGVTFDDYVDDPFILLPLDTVIYSQDTGNIVLPASFGFGLTIRKGTRWLAGIDFSQQYWSGFSFLGQNDSLVNSNRVNVGLQLTPDFYSVNNYLKTIHYRIGVFYENTNLKINGNQLTKYGTSFGLGLPLKRLRSTLSLGFEYGIRGTTDNNLLKEEYWNARFGLTLNDTWFIKRKYD